MSVDKEINIKHRLTGAAILITLGVIILPMLLGSYSQGDSDKVVSEVEKAKAELRQNTSFKNIEEDDIKVFVSKIRPTGEGSELKAIEKAKPVAKKEISTSTKKTLSNTSVKSEGEVLKEKLAAAMNKPLIKRKAENIKPVASLTDTKKELKKAVEKKVAKVSIPVIKPIKENVIKEGYIVSVGVYSQPQNAENVMKRLVEKGFKPTKRTVNTSKGRLPRVWLGPFATRAEAGKQKQLLQKRLGELGSKTLIKRYP